MSAVETRAETISVLITDDHTVAREGLRSMLETDAEVAVVGEASHGREALDLVAELRPQVVLMDVRMPGMDGLEATRRIKAEHPETAVIMITSYDDEALVLGAVREGAAGYLSKDASRDLLSHTIKAAANGDVLIKATLLRRALSGLASVPGSIAAERTKTDTLTEREQEILKFLADGLTNREIAESLCLAEVTVKKHIQSILGKLRASDRTHAATIAIRTGLID